VKKDAKIELLRRVPLFSACSKSELAQIASLSDELHFDAGRTLIREGAPGREFIVVVDGKVDVRRKGRKLPVRGGDSFFGELALLTNSPRSATVTTTTPVRALVIADHSFQRLLSTSRTIQMKVLRSLAERLAADERY
jgi:CRP/FNR family transcriptional regulator, cyclic AMP receptor protein